MIFANAFLSAFASNACNVMLVFITPLASCVTFCQGGTNLGHGKGLPSVVNLGRDIVSQWSEGRKTYSRHKECLNRPAVYSKIATILTKLDRNQGPIKQSGQKEDRKKTKLGSRRQTERDIEKGSGVLPAGCTFRESEDDQ